MKNCQFEVEGNVRSSAPYFPKSSSKIKDANNEPRKGGEITPKTARAVKKGRERLFSKSQMNQGHGKEDKPIIVKEANHICEPKLTKSVKNLKKFGV